MKSSLLSDILIPRGASVAETIVHEVAGLAIDGKMRPGDRFPSEAELAEAWKVGRSSIREAFRVFQMLGVTTAKPGRGTILVNTAPLFALIDWSHHTRPEIVSDIVEARLALEPLIASLAAKRADEDGIRRIEATIEAGRKALGNAEASIQAALDFHTAIAEAAGNETLLLVTKLLRSLYQESARLTRRRPESYSHLLADHERILSAIRNRNPEAAARASEAHMRHGLKLVFAGGLSSGKKGRAPVKKKKPGAGARTRK